MSRRSILVSYHPLTCFFPLLMFFFVAVLLVYAGGLPHEWSIWLSFFSWQWAPDVNQWGVLPMVLGTFQVSVSAWLLAFPWAVALSAGLVLWPERLRIVSFVLQAMIGVPSLLYGFFSVGTLVAMIRLFSDYSGYSWLATSLTIAVLIVPSMTLILLEGWHQLPRQAWLGTQVLGFAPVDRAWALLPALRPSLLRAGALGYGRAIGDSMIALFVSGNIAWVTGNPLDGVRTLSSHIAMMANSDGFSPAFASIFISALFLGLLACLPGAIALIFRQAPFAKIFRQAPSFSSPRWNQLGRVSRFYGVVLALTLFCTGAGSMSTYVAWYAWSGIAALSSLAEWWVPMLTSLFLALCVVAIACPVGILLACALHNPLPSFWKKNNERALAFFAGMPSILIGLWGMMGVLLLRQHTALTLLTGFGLAVGCLVVLTLPTMVQSARAGLAQVPSEWYHTGAVLGYSRLWVWWKVVFPFLIPSFLNGMLLVALRTLEDTAVVLLTGAVAFASFPHSWQDRFSPLSFQLYFLSDQFRNDEEYAQLFLVSVIWMSMAWSLMLVRSVLRSRFRVRTRIFQSGNEERKEVVSHAKST